MARRIFTRIQSFLSYKYFDRKAKNYWQDRWKKRNKKTTARGWNGSYEWTRYRDGIKDRLIKYAERNPTQFFEKAEFLLKYSKLDFDFSRTFGGNTESVSSFLNPMRGKWGLSNLMEQVATRALLSGKKMIPIARVAMAKGMRPSILPNDPTIIKSLTEADRLRGEVLTLYGQRVVADNDMGGYELMGANYRVRTIVTTTAMLALFDMEIFYY